MRSPAKGDALCKLFPGKPINYEIVADLSDPHGFDKVIKKYSFDGVLHIASPVTLFVGSYSPCVPFVHP